MPKSSETEAIRIAGDDAWFAPRGGKASALHMAWVTCFTFRLKLPSEGIPMARDPEAKPGKFSIRAVGKDKVQMFFPRRRNREYATFSERVCWCERSPRTCAVHAIMPFFAKHGVGVRPFAGISPATSIRLLRSVAKALGREDAAFFDNRSFRRANAELVRRFGGRTGEILRACGWSGKAFAHYLGLQSLECAAIEMAISNCPRP